MQVVTINQNSFVGGILNRGLMGRRDLKKYFEAGLDIKNFIVKRHGYLEKRKGFKSVATLTGGDDFRLIPFFYDNNTGYVLVFAPLKIEVYRTDGVKVTTLSTLYLGSELNSIRYLQCGDIIWLVHRNHPPAMVTRAADGAWSYQAITFTKYFSDKPYISSIVTSFTASTAKPRTIRYMVGEVVDGKETAISPSRALNVDTFPWAEGGYVTLNIAKSGTKEEIDYYNVYRNDGYGYGYIGRTGSSGGELVSDGLYSVNADNVVYDSEGICLTGAVATQKMQTGNPQVILTTSQFGWTMTTTYISGVSAYMNLTGVRIGIGGVKRMEQVGGATGNWRVYYDLPVGDVQVTIIGTTGSGWRTAGSWLLERTTGDLIQDAETGEWYFEFPQATQPTSNQIDQHIPIKQCDVDIVTLQYQQLKVQLTDLGAAGRVSFYKAQVVSTHSDNLSTYSFIDNYIEGDFSKSPLEYPDCFDKEGAYPSTVSLYEQRLVLGCTEKSPNKIYMSVVGDLYNNGTHQTLTEDDALEVGLPLMKGAKILHIVPHRSLLCFCENAEVVVAAVSGNALSYKTVSSQVQSYTGSSERLPPQACGNAVLFSDRAESSVREYKFDYAIDAFAGRDISILASELFGERKIIDWAYQQFPDSILWCVMDDGTMVAVTYLPEQEVVAWSRHEIAGWTVKGVCCVDSLSSGTRTSEVFVWAENTDGVEKLLKYQSDAAVCEDEGGAVVAYFEGMVPDAQNGQMDTERKRIVGVRIRGTGLQNVKLGVVNGDEGTVSEASVSKTVKDGIAEAQVRGSFCLEPRICFSDESSAVVRVLSASTDVEVEGEG